MQEIIESVLFAQQAQHQCQTHSRPKAGSVYTAGFRPRFKKYHTSGERITTTVQHKTISHDMKSMECLALLTPTDDDGSDVKSSDTQGNIIMHDITRRSECTSN